MHFLLKEVTIKCTFYFWSDVTVYFTQFFTIDPDALFTLLTELSLIQSTFYLAGEKERSKCTFYLWTRCTFDMLSLSLTLMHLFTSQTVEMIKMYVYL